MRCEEVRSLIKCYHEGTLDEFIQIKIHHHLAQCKSCSEEYGMWQRGEEYMNRVDSIQSNDASDTDSLGIMDGVMNRIRQEEKWANPSLNTRTTYSPRQKRVVSLVAISLVICFVLLFTTTLIPQQELTPRQNVDHQSLEESWENQRIVLQERIAEGEPTLDFRIVASIGDPIVYTLAQETKNTLSFVVIVSVFGILCLIIGMSWLTRV